jgi:hypothetical protein
MGNCGGETCAVQAGREARVNPRAADREASASGGFTAHRKRRAPMQSRKAGSGDVRYPYRKPTQVGWLSKLRWTSDPGLRNSAIYSRTFGRREPRAGDPPGAASWCEGHKPGPGDWITEPQVPAEGVSRRIGADACPVLEG